MRSLYTSLFTITGSK